MGKADLSSLLEECIKDFQAGSSLDEILARHPEEASQLRPLLEIAMGVSNARQEIKIPAQARALSRSAFISPRSVYPRRPVFHSFNLRLAFSAIIIICLVIGLLGTTAVSAKSLPGDTLYPVKLAWEQVQINLASGIAKRLELQKSFDQQRVTEVSQLLELGRMSQVTFTGVLAGKENSWSVAGIDIDVEDSQSGKLSNLQDTVVQVTGETEGNSVKVNAIQPHLIKFAGQIQQLEQGSIQVDGVKVGLDQSTNINGELSQDQEVQITARQEDDGELIAVTVGGDQGKTTPATNEPASTSQNSTDGNNTLPSPGQTNLPPEQGTAPSPVSGGQPKITVSPTNEENEGPGSSQGGGKKVSTPTPTPTPTQSGFSSPENPNPSLATENENQSVTPATTQTQTQEFEK